MKTFLKQSPHKKPLMKDFQKGLNAIADFKIFKNPIHLDIISKPYFKVLGCFEGWEVEGKVFIEILRFIILLSTCPSKHTLYAQAYGIYHLS